MLLNEKLKLLRKNKGLTQEELAEKINVSRQAITKWESGEGIPDIENLKQISILFDVTIDELIKEESEVNIKQENRYIEEIEIDHSKHFDIDISKCGSITIITNNEEKVKVEINNQDGTLEDLSKIKFDNLFDRLDIKVKNKFDDSIIKIYIPEKYINEVELKTKTKVLNIENITIPKLEFDGSLKYLNVNNSKGNIILNATKCDVEAKYDMFVGRLEVNSFNSTARVMIPEGAKYKTKIKGINNKFIDATSEDDSENIIELNGINSKIIIIKSA